MELKAYFAPFLESLRGQSFSNRLNYTKRLQAFLTLYGHQEPEAIERSHINRWYEAMRMHGYADATIGGRVQSIKAFFSYLVRHDVIPFSPATHLKRPKTQSQELKAVPELHIKAAVRVAWCWLASEQVRQRRCAAVFFLSVESGGRLGALNLRLSDWEACLKRGPDKNGIYQCVSWSKGNQVLLEFGDLAVKAVLAYWELRAQCKANRLFIGTRRSQTKDDPTLSWRRIDGRMMTRDIEAIFEAAGVPVYRTHAIRHYVGEMVYKLYGPKIAAMKLGHADAETTAATATAYYHRPQREKVSEATAAIRPEIPDPIEETEEIDKLFGRKPKTG